LREKNFLNRYCVRVKASILMDFQLIPGTDASESKIQLSRPKIKYFLKVFTITEKIKRDYQFHPASAILRKKK